MHIYLHLNICIHEYVSTYITPIYTCILTQHEYMYIHKYIYVNVYMLHTYCNKPHILTNNNTCIKITYYIYAYAFLQTYSVYYILHTYIIST